MFEVLEEKAAGNPMIGFRGRHLDMAFAIDADGTKTTVDIKNGRIKVAPSTAKDHPVFTLIASSDAWREFMKPEPKPGYHALAAMSDAGALTVEGDLLEYFRLGLLLTTLFDLMRGDVK